MGMLLELRYPIGMMDKPVDLFARCPVGLLTGKLDNLFSEKV